MLSEKNFETVIKYAPLFAIDLVVLNQKNEILIGKRLNKPAKAWWFVSGGRVFKGEVLSDAFLRISETEIGLSLNIGQATLLGIYDHIYSDSIFDDNVSTHYVNAAHVLCCNEKDLNLPKGGQHQEYRWISLDEMKKDREIHGYSKVFIPNLLQWFAKENRE
jgi:GDP-mannose mannosyl hydrolase